LYRVTVTRIGDNVYREQASRLFILTQLCLELALGEDALLEPNPGSLGGRLIFDNRTTCLVEGVSRANVTLSRVDHDLYRDARSGRFLRTFACFEFAYGQDALVARRSVLFEDRECQLAL
jgi:hypothetical protein